LIGGLAISANKKIAKEQAEKDMAGSCG